MTAEVELETTLSITVLGGSPHLIIVISSSAVQFLVELRGKLHRGQGLQNKNTKHTTVIMGYKHEAALGRHRGFEYEGYLVEIMVYKENSQCGGLGANR